MERYEDPPYDPSYIEEYDGPEEAPYAYSPRIGFAAKLKRPKLIITPEDREWADHENHHRG